MTPFLCFFLPSGFELAIFLVVALVLALIFVVPAWIICGKAGFSPWLGVVVLVPGGVILLLYLLAFMPWSGSSVGNGEAYSRHGD